LLDYAKDSFNLLTKRHLDFYYQEVLQLEKRAATPDQVHIVFELAKKASSTLIEKETSLNAKVDSDGNARAYLTEDDLVVNQAKVSQLMTLYHSFDSQEIKVAQQAKTLDGKEEPLPEDKPYWLPFGYPSSEEEFDELEDVALGFALASPVLEMAEGLREITLKAHFETSISTDFDSLKDFISIELSGEKKWLGAYALDSITISEENDKVIELKCSIPTSEKSIVPYDDEVLEGGFDTNTAVLKCNIDLSKEVNGVKYGYEFYDLLRSNNLQKLHIEVSVSDVSSVHIESDIGVLRAKKPFYPFGTRPIEGANFYIDYQEVFLKKWSQIDVNFDWVNTPKDFKDWYKAYVSDEYHTTAFAYSNSFNITDCEDFELDEKTSIGMCLDASLVKSHTYFTAKKRGDLNEVSESIENNFELFTNASDSETFTCELSVDSQEKIKNGPIQLKLNQSFFHEVYPKLYTMAVTAGGYQLIPNMPYTPLAENIKLSYIASDSWNADESSEDVSNDTQLFHFTNFGQKEISSDSNTTLVPNICKGGYLFIGLENAAPKDQISLLIQVLEGTENTEISSFETYEELQWAILSNNEWKSIKDNIVQNNTDNFLKSGIFQFSIPDDANTTNTYLPKDYIWLRVMLPKKYNAVCRALDIHAQTILATFSNQENDLSHLATGLEANTIQKLTTRIPQIKGLSQPYSSFGGQEEETDERFYRRVSERIRHKKRAITLWDYEHIILEQFTDVFKVKCLNHTKIYVEDEQERVCYQSAGYVSLVVVPDIINKNVFDIYEPRLSKATLNSIKEYVDQLKPLAVEVAVINPKYEQVEVKLEAIFYEGLDANFYEKQLNDDIIKLLSPWAFDQTQEVSFGIELHQSVLVDYLEKLSYVDYVQKIELYKDGVKQGNLISPSSPISILVSSKEHQISSLLTSCEGQKSDESFVCQ